MNLTNISETSLYSADLEKSENFCSNILNLQLVTKKEGRHLFYKLDSGMLLIFNPEQTKIDNGKVPPHGATGAIHIAFGIKGEEYEQWKKYLQEKGEEIEKEVEWEDGRKSLYFRDPSGNGLEVIFSEKTKV